MFRVHSSTISKRPIFDTMSRRASRTGRVRRSSLERHVKTSQLGEIFRQFPQPAFQLLHPIDALLLKPAPHQRGPAAFPQGDHLRDLVEREAQSPSLEDEREMELIKWTVEALATALGRCKQAFAGVEAKRPRRQVECLAYLADGHLCAVRRRC